MPAAAGVPAAGSNSSSNSIRLKGATEIQIWVGVYLKQP